jgi:hypothetical protein
MFDKIYHCDYCKKESETKNDYVDRIRQLVCHYVRNVDIYQLRILTNHSDEATREEMKDWILNRYDIAEMLAKQYERQVESEYIYFFSKNI